MLSHQAIAERVRLAQRGDGAACETLVRAMLPAAIAVALAITGRSADAEDVAQDAMVTALSRIDSCREPERFPGWVLRIVRNQALNFVERRRLRESPVEAAVGPAGGVAEAARPEAAEERARLEEALGTLSPVQREVVLLHDLEEWTHGEIAAALDLSEGMSRQHLFQARRLLRERLGADSHDEVKHEQG